MPRFIDHADYLDWLREQGEQRADFIEEHGTTPEQARENARELDADSRRDEEEA